MKITLPGSDNVSSVEIEWNDATAAALVAALDVSEQTKLAALLADLAQTRHYADIVEQVRLTLAREITQGVQDKAGPVGVVFHTGEWDDGRYYTTEAWVYFGDGSRDTFDFDGLRPTFGRMGLRHEESHLSLDLRTGAIEEHDICVEWSQFGMSDWAVTR